MRFLALDFETTGLDTKKDDPIQIGFLVFDLQGTIHASYHSLIKPKKSLQELKEIVQYVTGFEIASLAHAPSQEEVFQEVSEYLSNDLILIGHNVSFDLAILQRFVAQRSPKATIDTFDCARQLLHFQQSYALDALIQNDEQQQNNIFSLPSGKAHDAFYDAQAAMQLFLRWHKSCKKLSLQHHTLLAALQKNTTSRSSAKNHQSARQRRAESTL
jgi:DNA polymerase III subunit epsilon